MGESFNPYDVGYVDQEEFSKLLELLKEYTLKLRQICETHLKNKYKQSQSYAIIAFTISIVGIILSIFILEPFGYISVNKDWMHLLFLLIILTLMASLPFSIFFIKLAKKDLLQYDAYQVAKTVSNLIKTSSQYSEHAANRLSNKFEFDLRLAEAEATLHMYETVFGHEQKSMQKPDK